MNARLIFPDHDARPYGPRALLLPAVVLLALCTAGGYLAPRDLQVAWLTAWWFWTGAALGALGTIYIHRLTGGGWGAALRPHLLYSAASLVVLAPLILPLALWPQSWYPWAQPGWVDETAYPAWRQLWCSHGFFELRLAVYAVLWLALAWRVCHRRAASEQDPGGAGSAAVGMLVLGYTATLASVDLVASLVPQWYAAGFGLLLLVAQLKTAMALAALRAARTASTALRGDLGNLLLTYIMTWAYLEFTQWQIVWAENLPAEISWYLPRYLSPWRWLALVLIVLGVCLPFVLLLSRRIKRSAALAAIAALLAVVGWLETMWYVAPSIDGLSLHAIWLLPAIAAAMGCLAHAAGRAAVAGPFRSQDSAHA